jgi:hypothetical protein
MHNTQRTLEDQLEHALLHHMLSDDATPTTDQSTEQLAAFLAPYRQMPTEARDRIRQRISMSIVSSTGHRPTARPPSLSQRLAVNALGLALIVVALSILTITPLRVAAQTFVEQIRIGVLQISGGITDSQRLVNDPSTNVVQGTPEIISLAEASALLGVPVYEPAVVPAPYRLVGRFMTTDADDAGRRAMTTYAPQPGTLPDFVGIEQWAAHTPVPFAVGDAPNVERVTVRGVEGLWIPAAPVGIVITGTTVTATANWNVLVWEEGGSTFRMQSDSLDQKTMLTIANSLQTATP